jgi:orotate phosphoribosyltransferase
MLEELFALFDARGGHFRYESGHHGDLWLEIPRIYVRPASLRKFAAELARRLSSHGVEAVCGPLVEGALLAQMVAEELDVDFYFAEPFSRASGDALFPVGYRIPDSLRASAAGKATAVVDDVINAGSAAGGAIAGLRDCGASPVAIASLLVLGASASELAAREGTPLESLGSLSSNLWEPSACPLCASGARLEGIGATR